jgi:hypothetical protein
LTPVTSSGTSVICANTQPKIQPLRETGAAFLVSDTTGNNFKTMPFAPGQSGNPSGRPKADVRLRDMAREHTEAAVKALVEALKDERHRVAAATALLDRGWGKPVQEITGADGGAVQIAVVTGIERASE